MTPTTFFEGAKRGICCFRVPHMSLRVKKKADLSLRSLEKHLREPFVALVSSPAGPACGLENPGLPVAPQPAALPPQRARTGPAGDPGSGEPRYAGTPFFIHFGGPQAHGTRDDKVVRTSRGPGTAATARKAEGSIPIVPMKLRLIGTLRCAAQLASGLTGFSRLPGPSAWRSTLPTKP